MRVWALRARVRWRCGRELDPGSCLCGRRLSSMFRRASDGFEHTPRRARTPDYLIRPTFDEKEGRRNGSRPLCLDTRHTRLCIARARHLHVPRCCFTGMVCFYREDGRFHSSWFLFLLHHLGLVGKIGGEGQRRAGEGAEKGGEGKGAEV